MQLYSNSSLRIDIRLQLYVDLLHSSSSSNACTDRTSCTVWSTWPKNSSYNSIEHVGIQESSGKCTVAAVGFSRLLSAQSLVEAWFTRSGQTSLQDEGCKLRQLVLDADWFFFLRCSSFPRLLLMRVLPSIEYMLRFFPISRVRWPRESGTETTENNQLTWKLNDDIDRLSHFTRVS